MLYDELYGPNLPAYQGKMADRTLPKSKSWGATTRDDAGLVSWLVSEIQYLGGTPPEDPTVRTLLPQAATVSEQRLDGNHLVELGIGCEACHNGGKLHAANPDKVKASFEAKSSLMNVVPPKGQTGTKAQWINHTCAKCHTVLFTKYQWTWEGGLRNKEPGGSSISSGEGRDYQLGGCATEMPCTTCHDPHTSDPKAKLDAMATPAGNATCTTGCHQKLAAAGAVEKHAHHKTGSMGTSCIACHMPKKNMGLDYGLIRYHRIGSATDKKRVEGDRPLECALCHADKTVDALVTTMESWYGKTFDRDKLHALYGPDLNVNAILTTLERGKPHEQAVAISVLGELKLKTAIPSLVAQLSHEYPLVRYFAQRALQTITGDPVAIDVGAAAADVRVAADAWLKSH
jgi:predicted CXXCH cytochrome family protein